MAVILDLAVQGLQMLVVLAVAPLVTGFVRKVKARMLRRQGPPVIQPYRDLAKWWAKEPVESTAAGWLRSELYFAVATVDGADAGAAEQRWRDFLDREVTPRFPDGLSVFPLVIAVITSSGDMP